MSPLKRFTGPRRQRGAIGLMAAVTLGLALLLMVVVVDSGRLYMEQRKLQRVADNAALEAVSRGGNCQAGLSAAAYAGQSATRNGFTVDAGSTLTTACGALSTGANSLRTFNADPTQSAAVRVVATHTVPISVAAGIGALFTPGPINLNTQLSATAVAAAPTPPQAQLSIRSTIATVNSANSPLLNALVGDMLGGSLNISAVGWNGLLNSDINLLRYLDQLAIDLGVAAGNYSELLNTQASLTQLIQTAATVVQANGATADVLAALGALQVAVSSQVPQLKLGDILKLQTGAASTALDANLQLFQLMQAMIQLANSKSAVAAVVPANLLGLANVTIRVKVIEPPQFSAVGDPRLAILDPLGANRIYVRTAQVRTLVSVNLTGLSGITGLANALLGLVGSLTPTLNSVLSLNLAATINSVGCLLGAGCQQVDPEVLPTARIDINLELGGAKAYVTNYSCPTGNAGSKSLTVHSESSLADIKVGQIDPSTAFSSSAEPVVTPVPIVDLGIWTCHKILGIGSCGPARTAFAAGGIGLKVDSALGLSQTGPNVGRDLVYASSAPPYPTPPNVNQAPSYQNAAPTNNLVNSLSGAIAGISLEVYQPVNANLLGSVVAGAGGLINGVTSLIMPLISNLLSPLLDPLLNSLLTTLGINLMDVEVGANLTCGQTGRAYLVI
ncbi:pilus assembly protein TadG-related protein [Pseudomonas sp. Au-Pse12]|uniref:pilus assembly protein TadG-related protein n=1 Tax=Pseudomonas sp. Au-Pse12 TaxID=2906459 RepID=UPI001E2D3E5D|nr:pilus assembly protein TadG-related protein [Pseudomonas sp. Au-Pse12]MCE4058092.1 pilus assembly protein TadG-related protein [Pseudomonas sp. Au-Pse12]